MLNKLFRDWSAFEIILLFSGIIIVGITGLVFKSEFIVIICSIVGIATALLLAKGKVLGQFLGLLIVALYSFVSYQNQYYGETITYVFIMLPLYIMGIIEWKKNYGKDTKTVKINKLSLGEWLGIGIGSLVLFIGLYFMLKAFNTNQLLISTFSMLASIVAAYLDARRSKFGFLLQAGHFI